MLELKSLEKEPFENVHATFCEAFADYATDAGKVSQTVFRNRVVKNGVDFGLSAGAFDAGRLVGITLVGVDRFGGRPSAYDIATGIVPSHRGRKLAGRLLEFILPRARERALERFVLEVLRRNEPAVKAYTATGFAVARRFECFSLVREELAAKMSNSNVRVERCERDVLGPARDWLDWEPSWENTFSSVERIPDEVIVLAAEIDGAPVGVLAYYPALRWITTVVVRPEARRRGVASRLLEECVRVAPGAEPLRLNNVLDSDIATLALVRRVGFKPTLGQFEMARDV